MVWLLLLFAYMTKGEKCRSLAMSGGGSYGAYQGGVFAGLVANLPAEEVQYNYLTGISAGSLNSASIAQFPRGQEKEAADRTLYLWSHLNGSASAFKEWPGGLISGFLLHSGLVSTEPERELLTDVIQDVKRNVTQGCVNLDDGAFISFREDIGTKGVFEATMCSSAIPALFPIQSYFGKPLVDGGVVYRYDFFEAVERCKENVDSEEDIIVDMVECYEHLINNEVDEMNSINVLLRVNSINAFDHGMHNLYWAITAYPGVFFRYYLQPSKNLPGIVSLDFKDEDLEKSLKIGQDDAENVVKNNIYAKEVLSNWIDGPKIFYA